MPNPLDYSNVIGDLRSWYGVSSQDVWNIINQYNLTPDQLYQLAPNDFLGQGADGAYHLFLNNGESAGIYQQVNIPIDKPAEIASQINSNAQTGTAATTVTTRWAGNSVIDANGKVQTSPGVNKYANGSLLGKVGTVVATGAAVTAGWSIGMSLGKTITNALYKANPDFFYAYSPENWNNITADMGDGVLKKAINYLLQIDDNGNTQAYLSQEAFFEIAYALAQQQLFEAGETEYIWDAAPPSNVVIQPLVVSPFPAGQYILYGVAPYYWAKLLISNSEPDNLLTFVVQTYNDNPDPVINVILLNKSDHAVTYSFNDGHLYSPSSFTPSGGVVTRTIGAGRVDLLTSMAKSRIPAGYQTTFPAVQNYSNYHSNAGGQWADGAFAILANGTKQTTSPVPGVYDQPNASAAIIPSNYTPQQVADYITQNYPDLYNNRLEQDVVNPDGTTKKIIYYPVPMPSKTEDVELDESKQINIADEMPVILPKGTTVTLPNGTTATGDGVSPLTLPPGTYTLPTGTVIKDAYTYDDENPQGGSQTEPDVTPTSPLTSQQLVVKMLTDPQPQTATDPQTDPQTGSPQNTTPDTTTPNPPDTGEGSTPLNVIPDGSASALWSVYNPTQAQIDALGAWLWSSNFVDQLLKVFSDPMQAIIGLHKTYIPPATGAAHNIIVGYLDSGVSSLTVPTQYSSVDCGTVSLPEYFGNVFDYSPYTRVYIYLPFIGFKELDVSQVMRSKISVKYTGDAYTGACLAEVSVRRDREAGGVLYSFGGDCAAKYPLSSGSYMGIVGGIAGVAASAGMALGGMMNPIMGIGGMLSSVGAAKTKVEMSGGFSGNVGVMGGKQPYLVVMRPQTAMTKNYPHFTGQPANHTVRLGDAVGYVRVKEVHVEDIPIATDEEKRIIETALKTGVLVN